MNQVFLILVHKNPHQLLMLLNQLESNESHFFIHVDLKSQIEDFVEVTKSVKNIRFIKERYDHYWGSFQLTMATIALIKELNSNTDLNYSHAHLISGEDLLIKPIQKLNQFFSENTGINYMNFSPFPVDGWWNGGYYRITNYHFGKFTRSNTFIGKSILRAYNCIYLLFPFLKKRLIKDLKFYGGAAWWSLTKDSINYIDDYVKDNPAFIHFFRYSLIADEIFFQTIILNSKFKDSVNPDYKRFIKWNVPNNGSPVNLTLSDFNSLMNSDAFFARKINFEDSSELYKMF
jgi:hypothetical protein